MTAVDLCPAARAAIGEPVLSVEVLGGGRNSRVFAASTASRTVVVKYYYRAGDDPRDRQRTERRALAFLAENGVQCIPAVLHVDREQGFTILSHVKGERIDDDRMTLDDERDFAEFVEQLRDLSEAPGASDLDNASEAFFSLEGVLSNLEGRLTRLAWRPGDLPLAAELAGFLDGRFVPALEDLSSRAKVYYRGVGLEIGQEIDRSERVLSPSDFGLHNCVKSPEGLVFFDMEYFGWDDPAKLVSDFVLHPAQGRVGESRYRVAGRMAGLFMDRPGFAERLKALLPLFALKWCAIVLNEFLAGENARRAFAGRDRDYESVLRRQLGLAQAMLERAVSGDIAARLIKQNR
ncbi:MAG: phosphotransferase [Desulfovibrionaceae bacterium]|nr:phosphotransferase [Desulfovibrionaceae bacterium]